MRWPASSKRRRKGRTRCRAVGYGRSVVREGGVMRAASRLHRVPSNVTTRVKQCEERLGVRLFRRQGRGLSLTEEGRALLIHAERLLQMADLAEQEMKSGVVRGMLRLGSLHCLPARMLIPASFGRMAGGGGRIAAAIPRSRFVSRHRRLRRCRHCCRRTGRRARTRRAGNRGAASPVAGALSRQPHVLVVARGRERTFARVHRLVTQGNEAGHEQQKH